jgi:hypothetical protein
MLRISFSSFLRIYLIERTIRFIGLVLIAIVLTGCTKHSGEITVYPIFYSETTQNKGEWITLNTTVYRVSEERQSVIYWTPGIEDTPSKLTQCIVRDVKNWKGSYTDGSADLQMAEG